MKSRGIRTAIAAVLLIGSVIVFSGNAAWAQHSEALKANIPFGFYAGDKLMPPGPYRVETISHDVIRLTQADTFESVVFFVVSAKEAKDSSPRIVFHGYGAEKYLSELWWGQKGSIQLPSARERELQIAYSLTRVPLSAAGR